MRRGPKEHTISATFRQRHLGNPPHTYIHTYIHTYMHTYMSTYIPYIHTYIHTYIHAYRHTYIQTYIHTDIHTYRQTNMDGSMRSWTQQLTCNTCFSSVTSPIIVPNCMYGRYNVVITVRCVHVHTPLHIFASEHTYTISMDFARNLSLKP